jgi:hypothetical protein
MPLSNKRLTKEHYKTSIQMMQNKLPGWKAPLLSKRGRLTLVNSTLTSMPIFFMSTFILPSWVIKEIDKIRRNFLWHGHKENTIGRHVNLVAWATMTMPKKLGGLGVMDLATMNKALMTKNMWHWLSKKYNWPLHMLRTHDLHIRPWLQRQVTPFWKSLKEIEPFFLISTRFNIGNGQRVRFWIDA